MSNALIYLDDEARTRGDVLQHIQQAASGFSALGVQDGDAVAMLLRNDFAFIEAMRAAAILGAYGIPLNWHSSLEEILYILNDARPKVLVAHADLMAPLWSSLPEGIEVVLAPVPREVVRRYGVVQEQAAPAAEQNWWPTWLDRQRPWEAPPRANRSTLFYTSGTTGKPKGVVRRPASPAQTEALDRLMAQVYGFRAGMRGLICGPMYHAAPNVYARQALMRADLLVIQTKFDPEEALALIEQHRICNAVMVPTMFVRLLKLPQHVRDRYDTSSLRWVTHSGAPCPREVKAELMRWWGPVVYETYGGTETGAATLSTPTDWLSHPGSVGAASAGARIAVYRDDGQLASEGEVGEVYMHSPAYADFTYLHHEDKRAAVERDGLVSIGDIGYLKQGHLYLCDRRSDMVISGGANIYPAEIEAVLGQCPGVQDCAVFGIPDDDFGESLAAAVQALPGCQVSEPQIRSYLQTRIARYKVPRLIQFHADLPREDSGKIFKRKLRDPFWANTGRKI